MIRMRTFFTLCVLACFVGIMATTAWAKSASPPEPAPPVQETSSAKFCPKGSACKPVLEAWCRQNATVLKQNAKPRDTYAYLEDTSAVCANPTCCIQGYEDCTPNQETGEVCIDYTPSFLKAIRDKAKADVDCWLCGLLESILVRGDMLATRLYKSMSGVMLAILGIVGALHILWFAFRVFVDFSGKESRAFIQKSAGLFLRIAVVALILVQTPRAVGDFFLAPFISLGSGLGLEMLSVSAGGGKVSHAHITYFVDHLYDEDFVMGCTHHDPEFWEQHSDMVFSKTTCDLLVGLAQIISIEITTPIQFGQAFVHYAMTDLRWYFVPRWGPLFYGLFMVVTFFCLLILVPFKVVDIFVQLVVVACFLPLAITLFAFPATRKYTQGVWKMFLACIIQLIMLSLMVALAINLFVGGAGGATAELVLPMFLQSHDKEAYKALALAGNGIMATLGAGFIAFYMVTRAASFAKQLGSAVNLEIGDTVEGAFRSTSAKAAGTATGAVAGGVGAAWDKMKGSS